MNTPQAVAVPTQQILPTEQVRALLENDLTAMRVLEKGLSPVEGDLVGVRLNLNVMKTTKQAIQTLHKSTNKAGYKRNKGFYNGEACGYAQAVVLAGAYFNVNQGGREAIATGKHHKFAMASIDGQLVGTQVPEGFEGVEISFNPRAQHLFVDANNQAIHFAEEVVILGHRAYARGRIDYHTELSAPKRAGDFPSQTQVLETPAVDREPARKRPGF
jgi:hypothetical protein